MTPSPAAAALLGRFHRQLARRGFGPAAAGPFRLTTLASGAITGPTGDESPAPDALGRALESGLGSDHRRRTGSFFTPPGVAARLCALALPDAPTRRRVPAVCDPAMGGGAFLLAAADRLRGLGHHPARIVAESLSGADLDPLAVAVTEAALALWAHDAGAGLARCERLVVADSLAVGRAAWADADGFDADGFDAVVGNPPFLGQLAGDTARSAHQRSAAADALGRPARYADTAALFLVAALELARPGGRVVLVQPESFLAATDAGAARAAIAGRARLRGLWLAGASLFRGTDVRVCAPLLELTEPAGVVGAVDRFVGAQVEPAGPAPAPGDFDPGGSWSPLCADLLGVPVVAPRRRGALADLATATAGFRDQFYGIVPHVLEAEAIGDEASTARLVTTGLLDPARCRWGSAPTRFAGRRWAAPVVDLDALRAADPELARWTDGRLVPKVVVATQTKVVEAAVDRDGGWFPSVPVIAVHAPPDRLWDVAAVLLAPPVAAALAAERAGTGLGAGSIRLSARSLLAVPLPADVEAWRAGAAAVERAAAATDAGAWSAALAEVGGAMCAAYDVDPDPVLDWWEQRLPSFR